MFLVVTKCWNLLELFDGYWVRLGNYGYLVIAWAVLAIFNESRIYRSWNLPQPEFWYYKTCIQLDKVCPYKCTCLLTSQYIPIPLKTKTTSWNAGLSTRLMNVQIRQLVCNHYCTKRLHTVYNLIFTYFT